MTAPAKGLVLGVTGHRPPKLGGYNRDTDRRLLAFYSLALRAYKPARVVTGMALGTDLAAAAAARALDIPYTAALALPGDRQAERWSPRARARFIELRDGADRVVDAGGVRDHAMAFIARNRWIVGNCDHLLTLWNGKKNGGTWATIQHALTRQLPTTHLWERWQRFVEESSRKPVSARETLGALLNAIAVDPNSCPLRVREFAETAARLHDFELLQDVNWRTGAFA